jgi:hypothetical protein
MKTRWPLIIAVILFGFIIGCNETIFNDENPKSGRVVIRLTDAPFPADMVAEANITIDWIKLLKEDTGEEDLETENDDDNEEENGTEKNGEAENDDDDSAPVLIELEEEMTYNLLELSNGKTSIIAEAEVPAGVYREIRLHVVDASIMLKDSTWFDLKVPSGDASGLKIKIDPRLEVDGVSTAELLLDFDVSRSFVLRGNMKFGYDKVVGFIFKPVVRAVATMVSGEIFGVVSDTTGTVMKDASLTLLSGTDTVTTALTDDKGYYAIVGLLSGDYSLTCILEEYEEEKEELYLGVGESKEQNFELVKEQ